MWERGWEQPLVMTLLPLMAVVLMSIKPKPLRSWLKRPFPNHCPVVCPGELVLPFPSKVLGESCGNATSGCRRKEGDSGAAPGWAGQEQLSVLGCQGGVQGAPGWHGQCLVPSPAVPTLSEPLLSPQLRPGPSSSSPGARTSGPQPVRGDLPAPEHRGLCHEDGPPQQPPGGEHGGVPSWGAGDGAESPGEIQGEV